MYMYIISQIIHCVANKLKNVYLFIQLIRPPPPDFPVMGKPRTTTPVSQRACERRHFRKEFRSRDWLTYKPISPFSLAAGRPVLGWKWEERSLYNSWFASHCDDLQPVGGAEIKFCGGAMRGRSRTHNARPVGHAGTYA